jgi:hypothetical protein
MQTAAATMQRQTMSLVLTRSRPRSRDAHVRHVRGCASTYSYRFPLVRAPAAADAFAPTRSTSRGYPFLRRRRRSIRTPDRSAAASRGSARSGRGAAARGWT